ncbi:PIN domain-containing protein [Sedimentitalea todarodis]|uniref:PIN domain-containing protein n=1 Tax=Sedimentitalea todarodis TaxID=1631240 RepID=A0ABU3VEX4_9RHOB|nr:PIN domain-containing protein [Sedimentitalea todarodis]MDU9004727.1 PIN domain-containing protein [Sedimentitalea todarodis]
MATWLYAQRDDELFLSVISIGEFSRGIRQQEKLNPDFDSDLKEWLSRTETLFQDRILPFTTRDAQQWGQAVRRYRRCRRGPDDCRIGSVASGNNCDPQCFRLQSNWRRIAESVLNICCHQFPGLNAFPPT